MNASAPRHSRAITLLSFAAFASAASARLCDPMLPDLAKTFMTSAADAAQVVSSFSIAYGLLQVFFGPLGDRFGKYRLIGWATLACTFGTLGAILAGSLGFLTLSRLITGATAGGIIPLSMAWIGDTVPYEQRQATLARFMSGQILGVIGGQMIGGLFVDTVGWRWAFVFLAVIYLVVGLLVMQESRRNESTHPPKRAAGRHAGVVAQVLQVLRVGWARVILATVFTEGMLIFGALAFMPAYLHERFGLKLSMAGALLAFFGLGGLSYIVFARRFVSRFGEIGLVVTGGILNSLAWLMVALGETWAWALPASYLVGLGFYMLHNTLQTNATQMAPQVRGTAVSLFASAFFLGQSLGVILAAQLLARAGATSVFALAAAAMPLLGFIFGRILAGQHRQRQAAASV